MKKEEFFEVLGELDDSLVGEAKASVSEDAGGKLRLAQMGRRRGLSGCFAGGGHPLFF